MGAKFSLKNIPYSIVTQIFWSVERVFRLKTHVESKEKNYFRSENFWGSKI